MDVVSSPPVERQDGTETFAHEPVPTVRTLFPQYFTPTDEQFKELWDTALIVPDANVLLNLYRYTSAPREQLLSIFTALQDRLWMAHQTAFEFARRRHDVILEQVAQYENLQRKLDAQVADLSKQVNEVISHQYHPFLDKGKIAVALQKAVKRIQSDMAKERKKYPNLIETDPILESIEGLFHSRIGAGFTEEELTALYQKGEQRYEKKTPPGYKDEKKDGNDKYGDFIFWRQVLNHAKQQGTSIILITNDNKEDWWREVKGQRISSRPELIAEMHAEAGVMYYQYSPDRFMEYASEKLNVRTTPEAIEEVRTVQAENDLPLKASEKLRQALESYPDMEDHVTMKTAVDLIGDLQKQFSASDLNNDLFNLEKTIPDLFKPGAAAAAAVEYLPTSLTNSALKDLFPSQEFLHLATVHQKLQESLSSAFSELYKPMDLNKVLGALGSQMEAQKHLSIKALKGEQPDDETP